MTLCVALSIQEEMRWVETVGVERGTPDSQRACQCKMVLAFPFTQCCSLH